MRLKARHNNGRGKLPTRNPMKLCWKDKMQDTCRTLCCSEHAPALWGAGGEGGGGGGGGVGLSRSGVTS